MNFRATVAEPATIASLPPELLAETFTHLITYQRSISRRPRRLPLRLTHICSEWRAIALRTPFLWQRLQVSSETRNIVEILGIWIPRSAGLPFTLEFSGNPDNLDDLDGFVGVLKQHSRKFKCYLRELPYLQSVAMKRGPRWFEYDASDQPILFFDCCPRLTQVALGGISPDDLTMPWHQITHFDATYSSSSFDDCFLALSLAPNILRLTLCLLSMGPSPATTPILHSKVEHVSLLDTEAVFSEERLHILSLFTFPAVKTLELAECDRITSEVFDAFLQRSLPPLESLTFHPLIALALSSIKSFTWLQHLRTLEMGHISSTFASAFLDAFATDGTFLPRLQNLTLRCYYRVISKKAADLRYFLDRTADVAMQRRTIGAVERCSIHIIAHQYYPHTGVFDLSEEGRRYQELRKRGIPVYITTLLSTHRFVV
ncbi:hypothetical protein C8F01DRAFT_1227752, partial [Mycena amicta]